MTNNYLITLTPAGNFFFGSDKGFGDYNENAGLDEKLRKINYLVTGNMFPQQTTLLGMLRYELLKKAGLLYPLNNTQDAIDLIGNSGFNTNDCKSGNKYGKIIKISPIFLKVDDKSLFPSNDKMKQTENKQGKVNLHYHEEKILSANGHLIFNYDPKHLIDETFAEINGSSQTSLDKVFKMTQQIGIKKNYSGDTEEESFFKQSFWTFKKKDEKRLSVNSRFAFYVSLDIPEGKTHSDFFSSGIISMAGDQSLFRFEIAPVDETEFETIETTNKTIINKATPEEEYEILLLSDCRIEPDFYSTNDMFSVNKITDFRYLITSSATQRFSNLGSGPNDMKKSDKQEFLSRNSVLYLKGEQLKKVCESLDGLNNINKSYKEIGYNHYKIINVR